jgi:periplasmic divalent cation tolerance protein
MALVVYITCPSRNEAERIGNALLDERLAACVNILPQPVHSLYLWKGEREQADEIVLLAKTMEDRFVDLNRLVRGLHSYETPCVVAWPLAAGDPDYLAWLEASTRPL